MIENLSSSSKILQDYRQNRWPEINVGIGNDVLSKNAKHSDFISAIQQRSALQKSTLDQKLNLYFKSALSVKGKYQKAKLYFFGFQDRVISAAVEGNGRGTTWRVQPLQSDPENWGYAHMDINPYGPTLAGFFTELHETLFQKDLLDIGFSKEVNQARQLWRTEPTRKTLDEATPSVSSSKNSKRYTL